MKMKVKIIQSCLTLCDPPWTVAHQAPLSMEFSRREYWSGLPFRPPGDLHNSGMEPRSPTLQADSLSSEPPDITEWYLPILLCVTPITPRSLMWAGNQVFPALLLTCPVSGHFYLLRTTPSLEGLSGA